MELCQKAIALELEVETSQSAPSSKHVFALESQLEEVYMDLQPSPQAYQARKAAIDFVNGLARDKLSVGDVRKQYGICSARAFGSFTMDMFTETSDLDISLNMQVGSENHTREEKVKLLKKLTKLLYALQSKGLVQGIQPVLKAKVPVVKFLHCITGVECDVSVENKDGILKSEFLRIFSSIDSRFRKLCFLLKAWANVHGINSSKDHTLNSLSIILLVALHLQTRLPAILPPFSMLLKGLATSTGPRAISFVENEASKYRDFGKKNGESVVQLFTSFLTKIMAVKQLWQEGLCASAYEGTWTVTSDPSWMFVEDFTSLSQNSARSVNGIGFEAIYECCNNTITQLKSYFLGTYEAQVLRASLFNMRTTSAVHKRKRDMEDNHSDLVNHQLLQGFSIQQRVIADHERLAYTPLLRSYDSRFEQMMPQETISLANMLERGSLTQATQPVMDNYILHTSHSGLPREQTPKRLRLHDPVLGERLYFPGTDLHPLPNTDLQPLVSRAPLLLYQGYPERFSRNDQIYQSGTLRRLQSAGQKPYLLSEPRISMHAERHLIPEPRIGMLTERRLLEARAGGQTFPGAHSVLPPPLSNRGTTLYNEVPKGLDHSVYSSPLSLQGYDYNVHSQY